MLKGDGLNKIYLWQGVEPVESMCSVQSSRIQLLRAVKRNHGCSATHTANASAINKAGDVKVLSGGNGSSSRG